MMEPIDEQTEAKLVATLDKLQGFTPDSRTFQARRGLRDKFVEFGMPPDIANVVVGRMAVVIHEDACTGVIYEKLLEYTARNIVNLWKHYCTNLSEVTFLECCRTYGFYPPILAKPGKDEDGLEPD